MKQAFWQAKKLDFFDVTRMTLRSKCHT